MYDNGIIVIKRYCLNMACEMNLIRNYLLLHSDKQSTATKHSSTGERRAAMADVGVGELRSTWRKQRRGPCSETGLVKSMLSDGMPRGRLPSLVHYHGVLLCIMYILCMNCEEMYKPMRTGYTSPCKGSTKHQCMRVPVC